MATTANTQPVTTPAPSMFAMFHVVNAILRNAPATAWNIVHVSTAPSVVHPGGAFLTVGCVSVANASTNVVISTQTWEPTFDVAYSYAYDTHTDDDDVYGMVGVAPIPVRRVVTERAKGISAKQLEWLVR